MPKQNRYTEKAALLNTVTQLIDTLNISDMSISTKLFIDLECTWESHVSLHVLTYIERCKKIHPNKIQNK